MSMEVGARIPQISACISSYTATLNERPEPVKNFRTRCEGLSPFLFVYSITGNITYVLSILAASMSLKHLTANASWIAGERSCINVIISSGTHVLASIPHQGARSLCSLIPS